ncbi:MAG TPA: efflux RND transporter periplasmic adaptor subunit [Polyangiaceae bacterium]|nr:efflux RND transporter periplasmic adaptor subunit [Polyangiaceae bacterium]
MKTKQGTRRILSGAAALLLATGAIGAGYAWQHTAKAEPPGQGLEVHRGNLTETASASGKIEPEVQVEVKSRVSGQVIEVLVKEGDQVEAGQLLARLDPVDAERQLASSKVAKSRATADVQAARASLAIAELDTQNSEVTSRVAKQSAELGLGSADAARTAEHERRVAGSNVELKKAQLSAAQGALAAAELDVQDAALRLKETSIFAPISGTILDVAVEKGTLVSSALTNVSGGSVMMTLADLSDLRIIASVDEAQISRVQVGQRVDISVDTYGDRNFQGKVERVSPLGVDTSSVITFDVEIAVVDEAASLLRSGMSADIEIVTAEQRDVLLVPLVAIQSSGRRRFVKLQNGEERTIKTGSTDGTQMAVLEGLGEGDRVLAGAPPPRAGPSMQGPMPGMGMGGGMRGGMSGGNRGGR